MVEMALVLLIHSHYIKLFTHLHKIPVDES
jgi:hypothetical protein